MEGTRQVHFNWQAKVWRYMSHDCEEDEFQEEDTEEIICGQRVVNSRARLHLLEGKIKFARAIFITCQKWTFLRGPHVNFFLDCSYFCTFSARSPPKKGGKRLLRGEPMSIFFWIAAIFALFWRATPHKGGRKILFQWESMPIFLGLQLFSHFFGAQPPKKGGERDF